MHQNSGASPQNTRKNVSTCFEGSYLIGNSWQFFLAPNKTSQGWQNFPDVQQMADSPNFKAIIPSLSFGNWSLSLHRVFSSYQFLYVNCYSILSLFIVNELCFYLFQKVSLRSIRFRLYANGHIAYISINPL